MMGCDFSASSPSEDSSTQPMNAKMNYNEVDITHFTLESLLGSGGFGFVQSASYPHLININNMP